MTTIADLLANGGGSIKTGPFGTTLKASEYSPVGVPLISVGEIGYGTFRIHEKTPRVSPAVTTRLAEYVLQEGDIVFGRKGAVDRSARISAEQHGWFLGSDGIRLRLPETTDSRFMAFQLQSPTSRNWILQHATGTTMASLNQDVIGRIPISLPPLAEQRAIARILSALDDKIELNRKVNATLEAMARALFQSWFVDFDPVRAKAEGRAPSGMDSETAKLFPSEFVDSELGPIPRGWRATTLGTEVERCGGAVQTGPFGSQLHASDYVPEGVPVVMPKDIGGRRVSTASIARVREVDAARLSRHRLQPGDVVYSRRGDVERHALIGARETGWLCGTGCLLVRLGPSWPSPMFASFALDRPETRAWISQHAIGATMPNLNTGILSAVPLVMPSEDVLRAFARAVDPLQALVVMRDAEAALLAKTRDELLPRLLSGELPVDAVQRAVEEVA
ncbi:MAG: restriction endonuclease subunit S [Burkholderiales bacterium]|nr:restriction endonuclease subunit S [Burkholderiales bacterium]